MNSRSPKHFLLIMLMFTTTIVLVVNSRTLFASLSPDVQSQIEIIIGVNDQLNVYEELENLVQRYNGKVIEKISTRDRVLGIVVSLPLTHALSSFYTEMKAEKLSRYIELNEKVKMAQYEPNDPEWRNQTKQWSLWRDNYGIRANWAWNTTLGNGSTLVAVVDSGIDYNHEDLVANYVLGGYDWVNKDDDPMDDFNHGTHCAGIIAAEIDNGKGIAGIAQVGIMAEKCIDSAGFGTYSNVASAIINAVDNCSADIISMSIGFLLRSQTIYGAVKYAYDQGVLLVAAAGNDGWEGRSYPAAFNEVIAVSGTDARGKLGGHDWDSNYGEWIELAAPGDNIFSTIPETEGKNYKFEYGTSGACPHVAATAALIWSQYPNMSRDQVRIHLRRTARDLGTEGFDEYYGYGLIDANASVSQAPPDYDVAIINWERPSYVELGKPTTVNTTVLNYGTGYDLVNVTLLVNGTVKDSNLVGLQGGETSTASLSWTQSISGIYNLTSYVSSSSSDAKDSVSANVTTESGVIKVPLCRKSIQDAVDAAQPGDTIWVEKGTYHEIVNVWKNNLTIHGEDKKDTVVHCENKIGWGFVCHNRDLVQISGFTIEGFKGGNESKSDDFRYAGILLKYSRNCTVAGNIIRYNQQSPAFHRVYGLLLTCHSYYNVITDNKIHHNEIGMAVDYYSSNNLIVRNHFYGHYASGLGRGLVLEGAQNNIIYHNNFTDNEKHVVVVYPGWSYNTWDNGYPSGGNYWSNYTGVDEKSGPYQNETGRDDIGDQPYTIAVNNQDRYPLMYPWPIIHDVAVTNVWPSKTLVRQGETVYIYVTVKNEGNRMSETFNVTAYATGFYKKAIGTQTVTDLPPSNQTTLAFIWDTTGVNPLPEYTISAEASTVIGETDTADNVYVDGKVKFKWIPRSIKE